MAVVNNLFSKATYVTLGSIQPMQPSVIIEKSCSAVGDFYEKYLRFGPVGNTEKKFGLIMNNF